MKSRRFAWKYSSIVPCRSRWSWLRFVKTSTSKRTRSRRRSADAVRARLDGRAAVAGVEHLAEEALEIDRLRRRERRGAPLAAHLPLDRPDEAGPATRGFEDRAQQERRRRLPVRPRHARELELLRRLAEEHVGRDRHRLAHGRDEELRDVDVERSLDHDRGRAALDRLPREVVAVDPLPGTQKKSAPSVTRRVSYARSPISTGCAPGHLARRESPDQGVELHGGRLEARQDQPFEAAVLGASCGISRCWRLKRAISRNAGAATTPP